MRFQQKFEANTYLSISRATTSGDTRMLASGGSRCTLWRAW
jgi:hypothetical protein